MAFRTEICLRIPFSVIVIGALSTSKKSSRCTRCAITGSGVYLRALGRPFGLPQSVKRPCLSRDIRELLNHESEWERGHKQDWRDPAGFRFPHFAEIRPVRHHAIIYTLHSKLSHQARAAKPRSDFVRGRDILAQKLAVIKSLKRSCLLGCIGFLTFGHNETTGYCSGSPRRSAISAKVSPVIASVAASPVKV